MGHPRRSSEFIKKDRPDQPVHTSLTDMRVIGELNRSAATAPPVLFACDLFLTYSM
jgi:hypothetical protein